MPYFSENYGAIRYPIGTDTVPGLRKAQIGALHAISSHFTIRADPALVSLPTGAGKTLVLTLVPYILRANRVLVVTPSRLVRNQIAEEIAVMRTARIVGALAQDSRTRTPSSSMPRFSEIDVQRDSFQIVVIQVSSRTGRRVRP